VKHGLKSYNQVFSNGYKLKNKLFKDFKAGKQAQNGLVPLGVTGEVIPKDCQIKKGVVNGNGQPFY
jgi:hypothetical protein